MALPAQQPTYAQVVERAPRSPAWFGQLMAFVRKKEYSELEPDGAQTAKANLARYRGAACGVKYAEAVWAMNARASEIL